MHKPGDSTEDDPVEKFLRKVDISSHSDASADGAALAVAQVRFKVLRPICKLFECRLQGRIIFLPSASGRLLWDILVAAMIIYYLCMVPMRLAFEGHNPDNNMVAGKGIFLVLDILFDILFMIDIFVNFRTAHFEKGELVVDGSRIFWRYAKGWFFLDFIASLPTTIITNIAEGSESSQSSGVASASKALRALKWFKLIKLIRVVRMARIFGRLEHITMLWNEGTIAIAKSSILLWLLWHIVACLYWMVATSQGFCVWDSRDHDEGGNQTFRSQTSYAHYGSWDVVSGTAPNGFQECYDDWVPWIKILEQPFSTQYSQAFYWAVMVTVGVGKDINPQSETETSFTIFVIAVGIVAYALLIGNLSAAIQSMAHKSRAHNAKMERVSQFMHFNKVPHYMQVAVKQFYDFKWSRKDTDIQEENGRKKHCTQTCEISSIFRGVWTLIPTEQKRWG